MSLFEWLGEGFNPGGIGSVEFNGRDRGSRPRFAVILCFLIAATLLGLWFHLLWNVFELRSAKEPGIAVIASLAYLVFAYFVHPQPDMDNIGWLGGLFDHPFRYSDDINRFLIFLVIVLWPGRFIAESVVDAALLLIHAGDHA